jgi:hypothetical protein
MKQKEKRDLVHQARMTKAATQNLTKVPYGITVNHDLTVDV